MKLVALIVETRDLINLKEIISDHVKFLPKETDLIIYHSLENIYLRIAFPKAKFHLLEYPINRYTYNSLLTSKRFWEQLFDYDRVLIFQSDSKILKSGIEDFFEFDYIGASWLWNEEYCGNGGLSLRNPKVMYNILNLFERTSSLNEDHWFCKKMFENKIGNLAPIDVADKFACEAKFILGTFGVHAIEKYLTKEQVNQIYNQYI